MSKLWLGTMLLALSIGGCSSDEVSDAGCQGDECGGGDGTESKSLVELVEAPAACVTDADCCVVYDYCEGRGYVVLAEDFEAAKKLAEYVPEDAACVRCMPPGIVPRCLDGGCTGVEVSHDDPDYEYAFPAHCGVATLDDAQERAFADGGSGAGRVFGCGI